MSQYVRFSLTGYVYFPYIIDKSLGVTASKFKSNLRGNLLEGSNSLLPSEVSITLNKLSDVGFIARTDDNARKSISYQISIMIHADALSHYELDTLVHSSLSKSLAKFKAGLVIFSSVSEEKDTKRCTVRLGSFYNYNERTGLTYVSDRDFSN